jgi:hypothetical protein
MTTTPSVADVLFTQGKSFPNDINLGFNARVRRHLVHLPDPAVRPGAMDFFGAAVNAPQADQMAWPDELKLTATVVNSHVALGEVKDKARNETKHNWLWTTAASSVRQYEFDSFRVFVYSTRHRRYETAYIERNVRGYYPVETQDIPGQEAKAFSLVLEGKDGKLYKNVYAFSGYHVRMISKTPYEPPPALPQVRASTNFEATPPPPSSDGGWWRNMRRRVFGN